MFHCEIGSVWTFECLRKGVTVWEDTIKNLMVTEGRNSLLNVYFNSGTQITAWYIALFESNTTPADTDTYDSPTFTECTAYSESTRGAWTVVNSTAGIITNAASKATFTFTAAKTLYGGALVGGGTSASTKGNTAGGGTLMASAKFADAKSALIDDILRVTVSVQLSSAS